MVEDSLLALASLAAAIVGIGWKDPPRAVKPMLVAAALMACAITIMKSRQDTIDKAFLQNAISSVLLPSPEMYNSFEDDIEEAAAPLGYSGEFDCEHYVEGMACFLADSKGRRAATLVLNREEIATLYANRLRNESNRAILDAKLSAIEDCADPREDLLNAVGVLGYNLYSYKYSHPALDFRYDGNGVKIYYENNRQEHEISLTMAELAGAGSGPGPRVLFRVEQLLNEKLKGAS